MPTGGTALTLIKGALRPLGVISQGETLTPDEASDALAALNDLIEFMSTQKLLVWGGDNSVYTLTANVGTYTLGPAVVAPNFIGPRPVWIDQAYVTFNGVDFPVEIIPPDEFNDIALKTQTGSYPAYMSFINDNPNAILKFWPIPLTAMQVYLDDRRVISQVAALTTTLYYPPGYWLYMRHALALLLAEEYGVTPTPNMVSIATAALAWLKRANRTRPVARFDSAIGGYGRGDYWQTG